MKNLKKEIERLEDNNIKLESEFWKEFTDTHKKLQSHLDILKGKNTNEK